MQAKILETIRESIAVKEAVRSLATDIAAAAETLATTLRDGGKILVCGNGGSASDALHMAGELVGRFTKERRGLPCIALAANTAVLTAWSNDYDYDTVFSRQVEALGVQGDALIGITTSGNSGNIVKAFEEALQSGIHCIALNGKDGGAVARMDGVAGIVIPSQSTPRIQESHIMVIHIWCAAIEEALFG